MRLTRGDLLGYDVDRMVVQFTMLHQDRIIQCAISSAAMDALEGGGEVKSDQRVAQFARLRDVIEERTERRFFENVPTTDRPVILRSNDFYGLGTVRARPLHD
ncbi:DUF1488 domain-containing protein [Rhodoplanes sp. Z2-YC6860]|uniref:DUF1488 domain-containing protein n=1 Tax=Rhodoplanes sp. Z2-YC6860 TaxID=674703 RepID=UPI00078D8A39|nr:DUF1488 domain-containing protein [Rhodoplanes sp. Z2-YC6860]AMN39077.1 hypothetical protein RHPLAN_06150 [Rhodoplanes sp. Z2-YC6860]